MLLRAGLAMTSHSGTSEGPHWLPSGLNDPSSELPLILQDTSSVKDPLTVPSSAQK